MTELAAMPDGELGDWLLTLIGNGENVGKERLIREAARRLAAPKGDVRREPYRGLHRAWDVATIGEGNDDLIVEHNKLFTAYLDTAPQAAPSADERAELARIIDEDAMANEAMWASRQLAMEIADRILAAGFSKRAAPDVAVEVVDVQREKWELVSAIYDFIWDWDYAGGPDRLNLPALGNAIRSKIASPFESKHDRLAALPKGD